MAEHVRSADAVDCGAAALPDTSAAFLSFGHPEDVLRDKQMSVSRKRALLATWASDAHAVEHAPALRQLESGAIVKLDDILAALRALDGPATPQEPPKAGLRRRRPLPRYWHLRGRHRLRDDDDDPPPCPAAAFPVRGALVLDCA
jgi:hypothetical protein